MSDVVPGAGVLQLAFLKNPASIAGNQALQEAMSSVTQLIKIMRPSYPVELHANDAAIAWLQRESPTRRTPWNRVVPLRLDSHIQPMLRGVRGVEVFVYKLAAFKSTSYERALFIDNDIHVLQASLVHTLLSATLNVADIAMPLDINRGTGASSTR